MPVSSTPRIKRSRSTLLSTISLAGLRWKQTWFLLLIMTLGMIAAVIIVCAFPLFTDIMNTAGLRHELRATPTSSEVQIDAVTLGLSTSATAAASKDFSNLLAHDLGNLVHPTQFMIVSSDYSLAVPQRTSTNFTVYGVSMQQAAPHFGHITGQLAQVTPAGKYELDVMMTPDSAKKLGLKVGDTFPLQLSYFSKLSAAIGSGTRQVQAVTARVAGLFNVDTANAAYWHGQDFKFVLQSDGPQAIDEFSIVVPEESLLAIDDTLAARAPKQVDASGHVNAQPPAIYSIGQTLRWYYQLDASRVSIDQLDDLINRFAALQSDYEDAYGSLGGGGDGGASAVAFPYLFSSRLDSSLVSTSDTPSILENFSSRLDVSHVPVVTFTIQIVLLVLFFISLMVSLLIESQATSIALLRSRGASNSQIFGSLFIHCVLLGIGAVCIGVPLTLLAVTQLAQILLPPESRDALALVTAHPWQAIQEVIWYAVGIFLILLTTMTISLYLTTRMDVLALRRDAARTSKRPLWQRFNLDVLAGVVAIAGYLVSLYLNSINGQIQGDATALIVTPLSVIAPFFLVLGCLLLLLRLFPLLLRFGAWLAVRGRSAGSMLALAQISRAPRLSVRVAMLLALSIAFLCFTLVYQSTQAQHIQDLTTYMAGADFGGDLPITSNVTSVKSLERPYLGIAGILSASSGFVDTGSGGMSGQSLQIRAVDTATFGQTATWPSLQAAQSGDALLKRLATMKMPGAGDTMIPVIVDTNALQLMRLHAGSLFSLSVNAYPQPTMTCLVIGVIPRIPTIDDALAVTSSGQPLSQGGVLFDYATYLKSFDMQVKADKSLADLTPPYLNHIWLHSKDDATSLASVRTALTKSPLVNQVDRRALLAELNNDPLYLVLSGILSIGTITALLLALVGNLLISWLSARRRLTNFAVMRAIGSTPRQVASVLTWEQAIVYVTGSLLGVGIGAFIIFNVVPALTLTDLNTDMNNTQFYALQTTFRASIALPAILPWAVLALLVLYGAVIFLMVFTVAQPSLSQTLRLNED